MVEVPTQTIVVVQKDEISRMNFGKGEVLTLPGQAEERRKALEQAVVLGNTYKGKTKIIFEDMEGIKQVETHLWGITDKWVILKRGIVIPINRIHKVIF